MLHPDKLDILKRCLDYRAHLLRLAENQSSGIEIKFSEDHGRTHELSLGGQLQSHSQNTRDRDEMLAVIEAAHGDILSSLRAGTDAALTRIDLWLAQNGVSAPTSEKKKR